VGYKVYNINKCTTPGNKMPQKIIEPVEIESFDSILLNLETYIDKFSRDAIVIFRGTAISREQQLILMRLFGDVVGWFPNSRSSIKDVWSYEENHSFTMELYNKYDKTKDDIFLPWHLEHIGHKNPAIGASWNMEKFVCEQGLGNTLFSNISDVYDTFTQEEKTFLKQCQVAAFYGFADDELHPQKEPVIYNAVQFCEHSGRNALRLSPMFFNETNMFSLYRFDDRVPTEEQNRTFWELATRFTECVYDNKDVQQVHVWQQHDLVIVDLFLMAHAVLGGFMSSDRFFYGLWAHGKEGSKYD
jgi:alpha-ketoglutarate-dependent taurine dioxygenase